MRLIVLFLLVISGLHSVEAQAPQTYSGQLIGLQADTLHTYQRVLTVPAANTSLRFSPALAKGSTVSVGKMTDGRSSGEIQVVLVEPQVKPAFLATDLDSNGIIEPNERFEFSQSPEDPRYLDAGLLLPIKNPLFKAFPVFVRFVRGFKHPSLGANDRLMLQSVWAYAMGSVSINGKPVLFQYPFSAENPAIATKEGLFGIDVNGDGGIRNEQFSPETSYATNDELVFRYGDMFLSTASVDVLKNEIVVRRREKSEYLRAELEVGKEMSDFSFTDFAGKKRNLLEFRGKYLLVEFWGVWCVDCVRDMPYNVQAYERFRPRGFEILGMNWDDKMEDAVGFLRRSKADWPQARKESIRTLTEVTYRIQEYPSSILLGPDGKILELNQRRLQGEELLRTLDRLLPR